MKKVDDFITGDEVANILSGQGGADTIDGGAGSDTITGDAGDDFIVLDSGDSSVSGGAGNDTLRLPGSGLTVDLSTIAGTSHNSFELVELNCRQESGNTLTLTAADIVAISDTDRLIVKGDSATRSTPARAGS